jgi:hypothetical protein
MATIRKRGGTWQAQVRRQGASPVSRTFKSKSDAQLWARSTEAQIDRADLPTGLRDLQKLTLGGLIERYLKEVTPRKWHRAEAASLFVGLQRERLREVSLCAGVGGFSSAGTNRPRNSRNKRNRRNIDIFRFERFACFVRFAANKAAERRNVGANSLMSRRGRPPLSTLCVCCGMQTEARIIFPRSRGSPLPPDRIITACAECRRIIGRRRFWSVGSMRGFAHYHLAQRHSPHELIKPDAGDRAPKEWRGIIERVNRLAALSDARSARRLGYNPRARKRGQ